MPHEFLGLPDGHQLRQDAKLAVNHVHDHVAAVCELHGLPHVGGDQEAAVGCDLERSPRTVAVAEGPPTAAARTGPRPHSVIAAARREGRVTLAETESRTLLGDAGLAFAAMEVVGSASEAAAAAERAGCPVAVKLLSRHIVHKSDAGGVVLDVATAADARAAYEAIVANARAHARAQGLPDDALAATVSPMQAAPVAELLVGACRDPQLGPVLTIGAGGIWVEVLRDVAHRVLPVDAEDIEAAIGELRVSALLAGARGGEAARLGPIVRAAGAVAACLTRWPDVVEVEVNPLFVYEERVVPVDARVVLRDASVRDATPP